MEDTHENEDLDDAAKSRSIEEALALARQGALEPVPIDEGMQLFLRGQERESPAKTIETYKMRHLPFEEFCKENGSEHLSEFTEHPLLQYKIWLLENRDLNETSEKGYWDSLAKFLRCKD